MELLAKKGDVILSGLVRASVECRKFAARRPSCGLELGWHPLVFVVKEEVPGGVGDAFDVAPVAPWVALPVKELLPGVAGKEILSGVADQDVEAVWRASWGTGVPAGRGGCRVREVQGGRGGCLLH